ncbi:hypothetical protein Purlil1_11673 [Purpureocillium lilacinum]|uniref:Uncharacterized protein n=1 Tax=Purpureocillium lilacinum TaxID=33203 RepID=A0ABR0BJH3_PURLI|nr:hypothetical protein Purlil1_11673 [Purpureocillium lilacinum]
MLGESHPPKEAKRVTISPFEWIIESLHNPAEGISGLGRQAGGGQAVSARKERTVGGATRSKRVITQQCRHFQVASSPDSGSRPRSRPTPARVRQECVRATSSNQQGITRLSCVIGVILADNEWAPPATINHDTHLQY